MLSNRKQFEKYFVLYFNTEAVCRDDILFDHASEFRLYKTIDLIILDIFSDNKYPRGFSVTYLLDGNKSEVRTYLDKSLKVSCSSEESKEGALQTHTLYFKHNEQIKTVQFKRGRIVHGIKVSTTHGQTIEAGS